MSSNTTNYGVQAIVFDYRQEARGKGFNQAFCDLLPYGLYSGGRLTRISDTIINVGLLVCVIKSDEDDKVALRIETNAPQNILLASSFGSAYADVAKPYIVLRFGWHDVEANYMDMRAVGWSADQNETDPDKLHPLDIILGKVLFQEAPDGIGRYIIASENSFDLSRRSDAFIKETESVSGQFRVSPSELDPKKVFISGGKVNTSKGRFLVTGSEFPSTGIPDTAAMGRTDLIVVNVNGGFQFIQGTPSALLPAPAPKYQNFKVLAELRRGPNRSNIIGADIVQITDATVRGTIAAEDFPLKDSEEFLPANAKSVEAAFNYIFHHSIAISPQDLATLGIVLRRNVNWGTSDPDGVYAGSVPIKDAAGLFESSDVESVLSEIAGSGRTNESLKGLADAISALATALSAEAATRESADATLEDSKQNNLNRAVGGDDDATGTVADTGGALSVPISVTTVAPSASATQTTAGMRSLRSQIKILIDNIAQLFNGLSEEETTRESADTALASNLKRPTPFKIEVFPSYRDISVPAFYKGKYYAPSFTNLVWSGGSSYGAATRVGAYDPFVGNRGHPQYAAQTQVSDGTNGGYWYPGLFFLFSIPDFPAARLFGGSPVETASKTFWFYFPESGGISVVDTDFELFDPQATRFDSHYFKGAAGAYYVIGQNGEGLLCVVQAGSGAKTVIGEYAVKCVGKNCAIISDRSSGQKYIFDGVSMTMISGDCWLSDGDVIWFYCSAGATTCGLEKLDMSSGTPEITVVLDAGRGGRPPNSGEVLSILELNAIPGRPDALAANVVLHADAASGIYPKLAVLSKRDGAVLEVVDYKEGDASSSFSVTRMRGGCFCGMGGGRLLMYDQKRRGYIMYNLSGPYQAKCSYAVLEESNLVFCYLDDALGTFYTFLDPDAEEGFVRPQSLMSMGQFAFLSDVRTSARSNDAREIVAKFVAGAYFAGPFVITAR
jgi:hypothetical protein